MINKSIKESIDNLCDSYEIEIYALSDMLNNIKTFVYDFDMSEYSDAEKCFQKGFQRALDSIKEILEK